MTSASERFRRVDELFRAACRLEPDAREAFLRAETADDPTLLDDVRALLAEDAASRGALDEPALGAEIRLTGLGAPGPPPERIPDRIGGYRVIARLGAGGMGVVYEAEQDNPRRTVALKVINAGVASASVLRRFEYETQMLGRLQHPGIAQIFEAGTFDAGSGAQPYFAMELVEGTVITRYVDEQDLSTEARLTLLARVADAIHHAHQRGVIHRDLKPGNILVTPDGDPKVLDFGVARATDGDLHTTTLQTNLGQLIGTIPYMSPEQASGDPDALDTRSDVYALGVLGYELLAGRLPYDVREKMIHEAVRVIREDPPTPLSSIDRVLGGDVQTIIDKALEKDKTRRYASASDLAADIRRYLDHEPILARPASAWYQMQRFARRHSGLVSTAGAVLVLLVVGLVVSLTLLDRARDAEREASERAEEVTRQRDEIRRQKDLAEAERAEARRQATIAATERTEARRQARIAAAVNHFLNEDLLAQVSPDLAPRADVTMREVLDVAAGRLDGRFPDEPMVEAEVRRTIADVYLGLGLYDLGAEQLDRARELLDAHADPDDPLALMVVHSQAALTVVRGDYETGLTLYPDLIARLDRTLGPTTARR